MKFARMCFCKQQEQDERQISMEAILRKLNKRLKYERSDVFVLLVRIYTRHLERYELKEACFLIRELGRICEVEDIDRYVSTILARDILARGLDIEQGVTVVKEEGATVIENTNQPAKDEKGDTAKDDTAKDDTAKDEIQFQKMNVKSLGF